MNPPKAAAFCGAPACAAFVLMSHHLRPLCTVFGLALALGAPAFASSPMQVYEARVSRVFDGDTLWVKPLEGGRYRKLRLDGLDAPEICQPGGEPSRDALAERVLQQVVTVQVLSRDDYGRYLVRLNHGGEDVGAFLVRQGHAWSYRWRDREGPYDREEQAAQAARSGVFVAESPERPRDFRRRHGPCPLPPRP